MEYIYVVEGFDVHGWNGFRAIAFKTENEAKRYCEVNKTATLFFAYDKIRLGRMSPTKKKASDAAKEGK